MQPKLFLPALLLSTALSSFSQENKIRTASATASNMYLEILGNSIFLSLNYDQRFSKKDNGLGGRIGIGFIPSLDVILVKTSSMLVVPFGLNYLMGKGSSYFEIGAGGTYVSGRVELFGEGEKGSAIAFVPSFGYRHQPLHKGFTGRAFLSPFFAAGGATFYAGVSGGIRF